MQPIFTQDAIVFGILMLVLALVFYTASHPAKGWQQFYGIFPPLLLCYFVPALLHWPLNLIAESWYTADVLSVAAEHGITLPGRATVTEIEKLFGQAGVDLSAIAPYKHHSSLYNVASRYLLPASLIWLCLSIDFRGIVSLGPKALIMFFTATAGIIIGAPVALLLVANFFPGIIGYTPDELWRGLSTIAGSWIGGGANQTAMKIIYDVPGSVFATMVVVDIVVANIWMGFLLYGARNTDKINRWLKADDSAIVALQEKIETYQLSVRRMPSSLDLYTLLAVGFFGVAVSHWGAEVTVNLLQPHADWLKSVGLSAVISTFFWLVVYATTIGLLLSFTRFRNLEGVGASQWGSIFIYILVATIGMHMALGDVFSNLGLFAIGIIWMLVHAALLVLVAKLIRAPFFFLAVGSQANVGGAASAPVVASAFSPALAPVGVLLAVLGYALGTYGAIICAEMMRVLVS